MSIFLHQILKRLFYREVLEEALRVFEEVSCLLEYHYRIKNYLRYYYKRL